MIKENYDELKSSFGNSIFFIGLALHITNYEELKNEGFSDQSKKIASKLNELYKNLIDDEIIKQNIDWLESLKSLDKIHETAIECASIQAKKAPFWTRSDKEKLVQIFRDINKNITKTNDKATLIENVCEGLSYDLHDIVN
tara:strand:- start:1547 stop:1969 length:423 start_codon:yes stop_codon:yes gene_type:complete